MRHNMIANKMTVKSANCGSDHCAVMVIILANASCIFNHDQK